MTKIYEQISLEIERQIEIDKITLLSVEEYQTYRNMIPKINSWWWLRSPEADYNHLCAAEVDDGGWVVNIAISLHSGIRPVLRIKNPESAFLKIGVKFRLADYAWTMLGDGLALCDDIIEECAFRKDWKATDANDYEKSDVKKYLEQWAIENGIEVKTI